MVRVLYVICSSGPFQSCEEMAVLIPRVKNPDNGLSILAQCHVNTINTNIIMKFIKWIINDIHMEFNDIHCEGCLHITRRL